MSNCTLTEKTESMMEEYRFNFIYYLRTLVELRQLKNGYKAANELIDVIKGGREFDNPHVIDEQNQIATEAGLFLYYHYDLGKPQEFEKALCKLQAELAVVQANEKVLWKRLVQVVRKLENESDEIWFFNKAAKHHTLMLEGLLDRLYYYENELMKMGKEPELPRILEIKFQCLHGGLIHLAPFP